MKDNIKETLIKMNLEPHEWVTISEAVDRSRYSSKQIRRLAESGIERIGKVKIENTVYYNIKDIIQYQSSHQQQPIFDAVWDEIPTEQGECYYPITGYDYKYCISNKLNIVNMTNGQTITPHSSVCRGKLSGYQEVTLTLMGEPKTVKVHQLVGRVQCYNNLNKTIFHHINREKINGLYDNHKENILPVWDSEHIELHKLLRENKIEEYNQMVNAIQKENNQIVYKIPHPEYKPTQKWDYYYLLSENGYKDYLIGGIDAVNPNDIIIEYANLKKVVNE